MKKNLLLLAILSIVLVSCATTTNRHTSYATVGTVPLPVPDVSLRLSFNNMDYILFPRVFVTRSTESLDAITQREYLDIRLTGKAVRLKVFPYDKSL